jgi:5-methylcytosine-specific restriction endonuclease McrA
LASGNNRLIKDSFFVLSGFFLRSLGLENATKRLGIRSIELALQVQSRGETSVTHEQSLESHGSLDGPVLEHSSKPSEVDGPYNEENDCRSLQYDMAQSSEEDALCSEQRDCKAASIALGKLGKPSGTTDQPVYIKGIEKWRWNFATTVLRLNQAGLGRVISERQLYRHRKRCDERFVVNGKVDLIRYCAWLHLQRYPPDGQGPSNPNLNSNLNSNSYEQMKSNARARNQKFPVPTGVTKVNAGQVLRLVKKQSECCALTGWPLIPSDAALDHIIPISRGGTHSIQNAQVLRRDVNRCKGTLTNEEFIEICEAVVAHSRQKTQST